MVEVYTKVEQLSKDEKPVEECTLRIYAKGTLIVIPLQKVCSIPELERTMSELMLQYKKHLRLGPDLGIQLRINRTNLLPYTATYEGPRFSSDLWVRPQEATVK